MSLIKKGIIVGNYRDASDLEFLRRYKVSHILCSAGELNPVFPGRFIYKKVQADDIPEYNLARHFDHAADFIQGAVSSGGTVLIHCAAGISRSVSLTMAYFMKHEQMNMSSSLSMIRKRRYIANPNPGFIKQLREFERRLDRLGYRPNSILRSTLKDEERPSSYLDKYSVGKYESFHDDNSNYRYGAKPSPRLGYASKAWIATSTLALDTRTETYGTKSPLKERDDARISGIATRNHVPHKYGKLDTDYASHRNARKLALYTDLSHRSATVYARHSYRSRKTDIMDGQYKSYLSRPRKSVSIMARGIDHVYQSNRDRYYKHMPSPTVRSATVQDYGRLRKSYKF